MLGDDDQRAQLVEQLAVAVDLNTLLALLTGDQCGDDADRGAGQAEVGLGRSAAGGLDPAAGDAQLIGLAAAAQGQRRAQLGGRVQDHPDRVGQRGRRQVDHVLELLQPHPPAAQLDHRPFQPVAKLGQLVDRRRTGRIELAALDDAMLLEVAQALGEHVGGSATNRAGEGREAQRPERELAHDQHRPALADSVEGAGQAAGLGRIRAASYNKNNSVI